LFGQRPAQDLHELVLVLLQPGGCLRRCGEEVRDAAVAVVLDGRGEGESQRAHPLILMGYLVAAM
jgi:hypothetical protein